MIHQIQVDSTLAPVILYLNPCLDDLETAQTSLLLYTGPNSTNIKLVLEDNATFLKKLIYLIKIYNMLYYYENKSLENYIQRHAHLHNLFSHN